MSGHHLVPNEKRDVVGRLCWIAKRIKELAGKIQGHKAKIWEEIIELKELQGECEEIAKYLDEKGVRLKNALEESER